MIVAVSEELYGVALSSSTFQLAQSMLSEAPAGEDKELGFDEFYVRYATVLSSPLVGAAVLNAQQHNSQEPEPKPEVVAVPDHGGAAVASFELGTALIGASDFTGARTAYLAALLMGHPEPVRKL